MPESDRQKLIEEKVKQKEAEAVRSLELIRESVLDFLIRDRGYSEGDIEVDREFDISVDNEKIIASVDYIIKVNDKRFFAVKCSPGALESRERHLTAFARVVDTHQIPFAVVTDGLSARTMDSVSGKLLFDKLTLFPTKAEALRMFDATKLIPYPPERMEREKRILLAFDTIKCTEESAQ